MTVPQSSKKAAGHLITNIILMLGTIAWVGCAESSRPLAGPTSRSANDLSTLNVSSHSATIATPRPRSETDRLMQEGADAYRIGNFGHAASVWETAAARYDDKAHARDRCDALLDLAAARESLGSFSDAAESLNAALALSQGLHDSGREIDALNALGSVYTFSHHYVQARQRIDAALERSEETWNAPAAARSLNNRGNLLAIQDQYEAATKAFEDAARRADSAGNTLISASALTNQSLNLLRGNTDGRIDVAVRVNSESVNKTLHLADCHDKASLLITQGRNYWDASKGSMPGSSQDYSTDANNCYIEAARVAGAIGDQTLLSFALGYQGEVAESHKHNAEALALTHRALFLAQEAQSPNALYHWQWQIARLLHKAGRNSDAINAYVRTIETLQQIHGDLANGYGNQPDIAPFRESVGPIYYELADLLLRRADTVRNEDDLQALLLQARATVEQLKTGELEDYFQKKCVNLLDKQAIDKEAAGRQGSAVVYLIPLPDRTEMLISTSAGMKRVKTLIGSEELTKEVREFRTRLEDRTSNRYLTNARKLYDWIIRPIEPVLNAQHIDTLVFVPDGALRTIPMAALNDGKDFLIVKYAIAITPGLTLMTPRATGYSTPIVLGGGLSQSINKFPPLEFVPQELKGISQLFGGTELLNRNFTRGNLTAQMSEHAFTIVHFASHAEFSHDEKETFLLMYPDPNDPRAKEDSAKLTLNQLRGLLNLSRYRDQPIDLLALSACQTAAGDDRAALGLAGVAIEMGARTAIATLWSINDQASADLVEHFYTSRHNTPGLSKAKAMQRAQLELLQDARYRHPCYWAPYLVIGNWS